MAYNQLVGTVPSVVTSRASPDASRYVGNCLLGYPPYLAPCDSYFLGAPGASCTATCSALNMQCNPTYSTSTSAVTFFNDLGVNCTTPTNVA